MEIQLVVFKNTKGTFLQWYTRRPVWSVFQKIDLHTILDCGYLLWVAKTYCIGSSMWVAKLHFVSLEPLFFSAEHKSFHF